MKVSIHPCHPRKWSKKNQNQNGQLKKPEIFKTANSQKMFPKISEVRPWVSRIDWWKDHCCGSTYFFEDRKTFWGLASFTSLESNLSRLSQGFIKMTHQFFHWRQPYPCYLSSDPCLKFWFLHQKFCQFLPSNQHLDHQNLGITKFRKFKKNFLQI